jgi:hypothetical protein
MSKQELYRNQFTHSFSIGGRKIATHVGGDDTTMVLRLEPGVTQEEVEKMDLFKHYKLEFDEGENI